MAWYKSARIFSSSSGKLQFQTSNKNQRYNKRHKKGKSWPSKGWYSKAASNQGCYWILALMLLTSAIAGPFLFFEWIFEGNWP